MSTQTVYRSSPLEDKVALVTGGGRGLGAALCLALAEAGAKVVVADIRAETASAMASQLSGRGYEALALTLDVGNADSVDACLSAATDRFGPLDILVNNAGIDYTLPVEKLDVAQWDQVMSTNLRGPFILSRRAIQSMTPRRSGHIVNIVSTAAKRTWPNAAAYHASKWGLLGLSHALHAELRPLGIKVTAVITGGMRTPFLLDRFPDIDQNTLQPPERVATAVVQAISLQGDSVVPEITVLPMGETSWP
jgi:NAD(P)-dependent dehydrogenase (short-subunit alcohol dehydrogenase family)